MSFVTLLIIILICYFFCVYFYRKSFYFEFSFFCTASYFLLMPSTFLIITGALPIPLEFYAGTNIDWVYWPNDFFYVIFVYLSLFSCGALFIASRHSGFYFNGTNKFRCKLNNTDISYGNRSISFFFAIYVFLALLIFNISGLASGEGHWAVTKEEFMHEGGAFAVLLGFTTAGARILAISIIFVSLLKNGFRLFPLMILMSISIVDIYSTGNRITTLMILFGIFLIMLKNGKKNLLVLMAIISVPFGFFMSMYRIIRSQLHGNDSILEGFLIGWDIALNSLNENVTFEFVSGISESINFNVLIDVLRNYGNTIDFIYGLSYLKTFVWWIPRSIYSICSTPVAASTICKPPSIEPYMTD